MKILDIDIACGFTLLFSMLHDGHNTPQSIPVIPDTAIYYSVSDTPQKDTCASVLSLDSARIAAEVKVKKSLEETSLRISRLHKKHKRYSQVYFDTTIVFDSTKLLHEIVADSVQKKSFFKRLFKLN